MSLVLQKTEKFDIQAIEKILKNEGLPYQDVNAENIEFFKAFADKEFVGIVGLENFSDEALLRSMVIFDKFRNNGFGREIINQILKKAKVNGVNEIFILTTTAKDFFERLGFEIIARKNVPESIKLTTEFSSLCPESAICMHINL